MPDALFLSREDYFASSFSPQHRTLERHRCNPLSPFFPIAVIKTSLSGTEIRTSPSLFGQGLLPNNFDMHSMARPLVFSPGTAMAFFPLPLFRGVYSKTTNGMFPCSLPFAEADAYRGDPLSFSPPSPYTIVYDKGDRFRPFFSLFFFFSPTKATWTLRRPFSFCRGALGEEDVRGVTPFLLFFFPSEEEISATPPSPPSFCMKRIWIVVSILFSLTINRLSFRS